MQLKSLDVSLASLDEIFPYEENAKIHTEKSVDALIHKVKRFQYMQPILVNITDKTIVAGHKRRLAAIKMGWNKVPVIWMHFTPEEASALRLADNKDAEGQYDEGKLSFELKYLSDSGFDLSYTGFDMKELDFYLQDDLGDLGAGAGKTVEERAPEVSHVKMFQLFLNDDTYPELVTMINVLQNIYGTTTATDTILALVRERYKAFQSNPSGLVG